ncbi:MAG: DUF2461 domain-containing protein [Bacteroidota bacterium]
MAYFTQDYLDFFANLSANNHREWFQANKKRYENSVKKPFAAFVDALIERVQGEDDPEIRITPKEAIFRINRDIRFSKDKTPYKNHMSAVVSRGGRKEMTRPGLYVQLNHENLQIYGGLYMLDKQQLYRVRTYIMDHLPTFEKLLTASPFSEKFDGLHGEKNKRLPKEFQEAAEEQALLYNKSFYHFVHLPATHIPQDDLIDVIMDYHLAASPMRNFLTEALGE